MRDLESVDCPLCRSADRRLWATENGFECVRCSSCGLLYVSPRPYSDEIDKAVQMGRHSFEDGGELDTRAKREIAKGRSQAGAIRVLYEDELRKQQPVRWLDVGAGYGEFIAMLQRVLPGGSLVEGIEPMDHKVKVASSLGIPVRQGYLPSESAQFDVVSLIDVFSHIPDFGSFLTDIKRLLRRDGEVLLKTGNAADIGHRRGFPGPLNLPDHLVFGGVAQLTRFLSEAGFDVLAVHSQRIDGIWYSFKNAVKSLMGKPVYVSFPYASPTRTLWIRARLKAIE